jgi:gluconolactonase
MPTHAPTARSLARTARALALGMLPASLLPATLALADHAPTITQSAPIPAALVDLRTVDGAALVSAQWSYRDAHIADAQNFLPGPDAKPTKAAAPTHDIHPRFGSPDFGDAAAWQAISADTLEHRRTAGKLAFGWYRLTFTVPEQLAGQPTRGSRLELDLTADDYAEVWVDGALPTILGSRGGVAGAATIAGWNAPQRVVVTTDATPGQKHELAIFVANGPLSAPPANYVWLRSASLHMLATPTETMAHSAGSIERLDPALDAIIDRDARIERLATGFGFTEGPVWLPRVTDARYGGAGPGGYLLFSDPNQNVIHRFDPTTRAVTVFRTNSGYSGVNIAQYHQPGSNGLALDAQGRLTICEHGNRRVTRLEPNGAITVLADRFDGKRLNSPNDVVYRSDGAMFFSDPPFGLPKVYDDPARELQNFPVFCLKDGVLSPIITDLKGPNGLAFSPDQRTLYVGNWDERRKVVMAYDLAPDGSASSPRVFFDAGAMPGDEAIDGVKVDPSGNVYISGPGGLWIVSPKGTMLGAIKPDELPANFAFGGADGKDLYMTARHGLYRMRVK